MVEVIERRLLSVDVDGFVWIKRGSVIAYNGALRFHLDPVFQPDAVRLLTGPLRGAILREAVPIARAVGTGRLYVSLDGRFSTLIRLSNETIFVASTNLLAFESTLEHQIQTVGSVGLLAGGLFVVRLSGTGFVALSSSGTPLPLRVTERDPLSTDPTATVAWSAGLWPELKTDLGMGSLVAHGGGEPIQMCFRGQGQVFVHARSRAEVVRSSMVRRISTWIMGMAGLPV